MSIEKRLNLLNHAKQITGSTDMSTIIQATKELESFLEQPFEKLVNYRDDFNAFLPHCMFAHPVKGIIPFAAYPYQTMLASVLQHSDFTIINTARQMGTTMMLCAYALWLAAFGADQTIAIAANKFAMAKEIISRIRFMADHTVVWLPKMVVANASAIEFDNGCRIVAFTANENAGKGMSINTLLIDNASFISYSSDQHMEYLCAVPLMHGGKVVVASTPYYTEGFFYKLWSDPIKYQAARIMIDHTMHPGHKERVALMKETMSPEMFEREHGCQFITKP
jgi:Terminase large subunit, T4likevirus-type, N-terminal